jgi:drug/metabolite transporter (DMT)-like permease
VASKNIVRVVLWMTGALLCFSAMAVSVRILAATLGVMEILALRAGFGLMVVATFAALRAELRATINCQHLQLHLFRNTVHVGSSYLWAMSLLVIPLAMTFALEFTTPAWTLLLAAPVLGERLTASRIGAVVFGLLGVLVILRPGLAAFQPGALLALMAAFGLAVTLIATKKLTRTDSTFAILFWMMLIQLPLTLIASEPLFVTKLNHEQIPAVIGIGASGVASHYCLANAFRAGDAGVVVPLDFMRIPLIAVIGWWLYGESLDVFVFLGAGLIITGILWNLRSETGRAPRSET